MNGPTPSFDYRSSAGFVLRAADVVFRLLCCWDHLKLMKYLCNCFLSENLIHSPEIINIAERLKGTYECYDEILLYIAFLLVDSSHAACFHCS